MFVGRSLAYDDYVRLRITAGLVRGSLHDKVSERLKTQMQTASKTGKVARESVNGAKGLKSTAIAAKVIAQKYFPPRAVCAMRRSAAERQRVQATPYKLRLRLTIPDFLRRTTR